MRTLKLLSFHIGIWVAALAWFGVRDMSLYLIVAVGYGAIEAWAHRSRRISGYTYY